VLHVARCKYRTQKIVKNLPSGHHRTTLSGYIFATKARIDNRKKLVSSNISSTCPHNMVNVGPQAAEIGSGVWGTPANSKITGFASWQRYCSDVAQRKPTKLCTVFGHLLGWYTTYTFSGVLAPLRNFARCKIHFAFKSCAFVFYCMALQQRASAKLRR